MKWAWQRISVGGAKPLRHLKFHKWERVLPIFNGSLFNTFVGFEVSFRNMLRKFKIKEFPDSLSLKPCTFSD